MEAEHHAISFLLGGHYATFLGGAPCHFSNGASHHFSKWSNKQLFKPPSQTKQKTTCTYLSKAHKKVTCNYLPQPSIMHLTKSSNKATCIPQNKQQSNMHPTKQATKHHAHITKQATKHHASHKSKQ